MRPIAIVTALLVSESAFAAGQPSVADVLASLHKVVKLHSVALSLDGTRVAWVEQVPTPDGPASDRSIIQIVERAHPERAQRITALANKDVQANEKELEFSPDGTKLVFLSDAEKKKQLQVIVADVATGKTTQLTHASGHLGRPHFSPDGKTVAVLLVDGAVDADGPLGPAARPTGVVEEHIAEQRISIVPTDGSAQLKQVSPPTLFVYEYDWRPDGKAFAATAAPGSGDNNWWEAQLHVIDLGGGDKTIYKPALQICEPSFSPDGQRIAFIEGLMSDQGSNGGDVFVVSAAGGKATNLTPGLRGSAATLKWQKPEEVAFGMVVEGDSAFASVPAAGGKPTIRWRGPENIHQNFTVEAAFSRDGQVAAAVSESFDKPPEVVAGALGSMTPLTHRNQDVQSLAVAAQSITWKSEKFDVQGWLVAPARGGGGGGGGGKAPMVVLVHGGPAGSVRASWNDTAILLASQGFYVFMPNPRGSFGQGEAFTRGNVKDFGYGDLRDILAGVDATAKKAPIDLEHVGVYGHSYGGYMAMFAVTQTRRFKASVASAGIANWQSYYGQNGIDKWMIPYFGKSVYEDPAVYAKSSPITFINKVKTPTLVLHGERDAECPLPQGQEFWHALKTIGVDTQLVVYPDEGHHYRDPANERDHMERMVGWFDKYLKPATVLPAQ